MLKFYHSSLTPTTHTREPFSKTHLPQAQRQSCGLISCAWRLEMQYFLKGISNGTCEKVSSLWWPREEKLQRKNLKRKKKWLRIFAILSTQNISFWIISLFFFPWFLHSPFLTFFFFWFYQLSFSVSIVNLAFLFHLSS